MIGKNIRLQTILFLFTLFLNGCGKNYTKDASWAMETFGKLSLRQKIAQMLIYRMNMRFLSSSSKKWQEIQMHFLYEDHQICQLQLNNLKHNMLKLEAE